MDVGGVARDEDPADGVAVDDPVADPEDGGPAQPGEDGGPGGEPVDDGLDVGQLRDAATLQAVRHAVAARYGCPAGRRPGGEPGRHEHRHPVAARTGQRDADQQVVGGAVVGAVAGAHSVPGRQVPVGLHVGQHVLLREGTALEGEPEPLADHAVRAVAADQVVGPDLLGGAGGRPQPGGDPVGVLGERQQLGAALDGRAQAREVLLQQALGLVLRQRGESVGHLGRQYEVDPRPLPAVDVDQLAAQRDGGLQDVAGQAHPVPELQGARLDADRPGVRQAGRQPLDQAAAHPVAAELGGRAQPDRAGARDQYVRCRGVCHGCLPVPAPGPVPYSMVARQGTAGEPGPRCHR